jgi:hypothetical protein
MPLSFEQQPRESNKAFAAFSLYLGMGPQRSTREVAMKLAKSEQLIRRWSAQFGWTDRVAAYGAHMAIVEREATEAVVRSKSVEWGKRREQIREEEWAIHDECIAAGREALKRFYEKGKGATLGDIARMLELASKLGRLASGLATERTEVTGEDGGAIEVELSVALKKIYGDVVDVETIREPERRRIGESANGGQTP